MHIRNGFFRYEIWKLRLTRLSNVPVSVIGWGGTFYVVGWAFRWSCPAWILCDIAVFCVCCHFNFWYKPWCFYSLRSYSCSCSSSIYGATIFFSGNQKLFLIFLPLSGLPRFCIGVVQARGKCSMRYSTVQKVLNRPSWIYILLWRCKSIILCLSNRQSNFFVEMLGRLKRE